MRLSGPNAFGPPKDRSQALAVLRQAVNLGVDHIDTAQFYGPTVVNELIRQALHPYPSELILVSKVGARRDRRGGVLIDDAPDRPRRGIEDNHLPPQSRRSQPVLEECTRRNIAFVPVAPLGFGASGPDSVLGAPQVIREAGRLHFTPAQVVSAWTLATARNVLLIPGTASMDHLQENLAASSVHLDFEAIRRLSLVR